MRCERGQATIEWVGLVLLASLVLGALATVVPVMDGRSFGGFLSNRIFCAIRGGGCDAGDSALARAYGEKDADLVRRYAPDLVYEPGERSIPVDFRSCRRVQCAEAPDDPDLDVHRSSAGRPATAFTRVIRRGGFTYLQYWLYYPDSNSRFAGSDRAWNATLGRAGLGDYPGWHADDWEGYQVRLGPGGAEHVRASSHGHYQWCKGSDCHNAWGERTGWTRVSSGSHAGHIPLERRSGGGPGVPGRGRAGRALRGPAERSYRPQLPGVHVRERTSTSDGLVLVPLETLHKEGYRRLDEGIAPPWEKEVYTEPESGES